MITIGWTAWDGKQHEQVCTTWEQARRLITRLEQGYGLLVQDRSITVEYYS